MKIEEIFSVYEFLGKLSFLAFLGVTVLILIIIFTVILPFKEKLNLSWWALIVIETIFFGGLILLFFEGRSRNSLLPIANAIKTNCIYSGFYQKSFKQINDILYLTDNIDITSTLKKLPEQYPSDFILIRLHSSSASELETLGLRIVDPNALDKIETKLKEKALAIAPLVTSYMQEHGIDTMNTEVSGELRFIDNEAWLIGQEFFRKLVGRSGLMPVYDTTYSSVGGYSIKGFTRAQKVGGQFQ